MHSIASFRLMNEIMENFIGRSHNLYCELDVIAENKIRFDHYTLEAGVSSDKERSSDLRASSSSHVAEISSLNCSGGKDHGGKVLMKAGEVKQLNERLKTLEEEDEVVKQAFLESMEERKKLINEIYQQFQVIHHCLHSKNQVTSEESGDGVSIVNPHENEGTGNGLSQVLRQESNPSLVIRDLRSKSYDGGI